MKINHLIIGSDNIEKSRAFYCKILGFEHIDTFIDTGTRKEGFVLLKKDKLGNEEFEMLVVPFNETRLPSPQHIAFEVEPEEFQLVLNNANEEGLEVRAMPPLDCKIKGVGFNEVRGRKIERYYLLDPSSINIELMKYV